MKPAQATRYGKERRRTNASGGPICFNCLDVGAQGWHRAAPIIIAALAIGLSDRDGLLASTAAAFYWVTMGISLMGQGTSLRLLLFSSF